MMAWSAKPGQAYLSQDGIRQIKSKLTNEIFQQDMLHLYEQKTVSRDQLVREARQAMRELVQQMRTRICDHPEAERLMQELALQLETVKGKKSYGYLPKKQKALVDEIVDQMEQLPTVAECYEKWWELQSQVEDFYSEKERRRPPLSQQKEFRQIKNAVIQEAETIRLGEITFEDDTLDHSDEVGKDENVSWDFWTLRMDVQDEYSSLAERDDAVESMRELAENGDVHAQYFMGKLYLDGSLAFVTVEGDHLRCFFNQLQRPWRAPRQSNVRTAFLHEIRLVDGIYLADSVQPYGEIVQQLQSRDLLQVKTVQTGHYAEYDRTNAFYQRMGFLPLECLPTLWDEWNPCQVYVLPLQNS